VFSSGRGSKADIVAFTPSSALLWKRFRLDAMDLDVCRCGHSAKAHLYPQSTLFGDCHECDCELYNPIGGLKGVPLHPLFAFTEDDFRFVSCKQCGRFRVVPDGVCESCGWDNDNQGVVEHTRPDYCRHSPTKKHAIPMLGLSLNANYCRYCLKTIQQGTTKRHERVSRFWKPNRNA
jgi:hypothetical protein